MKVKKKNVASTLVEELKQEMKELQMNNGCQVKLKQILAVLDEVL